MKTEYRKISIYGLLILLVLNLLDAIITKTGLDKGIFLKELNPVVAYTLQDPVMFYIIKVVLMTLVICYALWAVTKTKNIPETTLKAIAMVVITVCMIYLAIVAWALTIWIMVTTTRTFWPSMSLWIIGAALLAWAAIKLESKEVR